MRLPLHAWWSIAPGLALLAVFVAPALNAQTHAPANTAAADGFIRRAMADSGSWPSYGRDYSNSRYAPLSQITPANAASLTLAWKYQTGVPHAFQASPVVVDGTMYVSTPLNHVVALDARTGARRWEYTHRLGNTVVCCGPVNRGVAVYGGRVFMGTLDARLVALDARDGRKLWDVKVADPDSAFSLTGTPIVVEGRVLVGTSGAEYGRRCFVSAYDAATGRQLWRFYNVPSPADGGWWGGWAERDAFGTPLNRDIAREKRDSAAFPDAWRTGGGSAWQAPAIDTLRHLMIYVTGNPGPDLDGRVRPGDNLYTNSIVALDYRTGALRWYFQTLPHDRWDFDAASPALLLDVKDSTGAMVPAVAHAGKTGWVYFVHRESGQPIRRSDAFVPQENLFAEPTLEGTRMLPGANGGSEWSPASYSPVTRLLYVMGMNQPMVYRLRPEPLAPPAFWRAGTWVEVGEPSEHYSLFSAIDVNTGRIAWQTRLTKPTIGGSAVTAGGVVFTGTADKKFLALDAGTGRELWSYEANAGVNAPPVSYALDGRQYVAVAAGGSFQINSPRGDEVLVFALAAEDSPDSTGLSRTDEDGQPKALPPLPAGMTVAHLRSGDAVFRGKGGCVACHGPDATGVPGKGSSLTAGLNYIPKPYSWAGLDSLVRHGISAAITRTDVACPARGARGNLTDAEVNRVAAYVWAIAQVRGEPWRGGHPVH